MANITKYVNQTIVVGSNTERLSTNGYYTGEHRGTPTQANNEIIGEHDVEDGIVRYGTIMGDATANSMPALGVGVVQTLTACTSDITDKVIEKGKAKTFTYTAEADKTLPETVTVKIGGTTATVTTDYTWNSATGKLVFTAAKVTGDLEITVTAS